MEISNLIFNFLILVGVILLLYFKFYVPSYLKKKGENLATKEDIGLITKEIKSVEAKIKIKESGEIDYFSLKRKIILDYFGAYNNWERIVDYSEQSTPLIPTQSTPVNFIKNFLDFPLDSY